MPHKKRKLYSALPYKNKFVQQSAIQKSLMLVINRKSDNTIMNCRIGSDWKKVKKYIRLQQTYDELPKNAPKALKDNILTQIDDLKNAYKQNRIASIVNQYGGLFGDYECVEIPEGEEATAATCRLIEYDGSTLTYVTDPLVSISGSILTISRGWVQGNYTLDIDDKTDFSTLGNTEDIYFKFCFYRSGTTVSVVLFTRQEHQDFGENPSGIFCGNICEGVIHDDQSITLT